MRCVVQITGLGLLLSGAAAAAPAPVKDKPAEFTLVNKAKDIRVVSDREESVFDFFRRNRVLVCTMWGDRLNEVLETKEPLKEYFVSSCSHNDDAERAAVFGARPDIAPTPKAVVKLIREYLDKQKMRAPAVGLILCRDPKEPRLYRVVGHTERGTMGLFAKDEKNAADGFSPKDLCFQGDPKK